MFHVKQRQESDNFPNVELAILVLHVGKLVRIRRVFQQFLDPVEFSIEVEETGFLNLYSRIEPVGNIYLASTWNSGNYFKSHVLIFRTLVSLLGVQHDLVCMSAVCNSMLWVEVGSCNFLVVTNLNFVGKHCDALILEMESWISTIF